MSEMISGKTEFILTLFEDTMEKLKVMTPIEALFDDERGKIPEEYWYICQNLQPGQSLKISLEVI